MFKWILFGTYVLIFVCSHVYTLLIFKWRISIFHTNDIKTLQQSVQYWTGILLFWKIFCSEILIANNVCTYVILFVCSHVRTFVVLFVCLHVRTLNTTEFKIIFKRRILIFHTYDINKFERSVQYWTGISLFSEDIVFWNTNCEIRLYVRSHICMFTCTYVEYK